MSVHRYDDNEVGRQLRDMESYGKNKVREQRGKSLYFLESRVKSFLTNALEALNDNPPEVDVARSRIKSVLGMIEEELKKPPVEF